MNQYKITEEQEWQLFELLEGNLSAEEANRLHQQIESNPGLAQHFKQLKQTYLVATNEPFPDAESLKKYTKNKSISLWIISAAAAAIVILLLNRNSNVATTAAPKTKALSQVSSNPSREETLPAHPSQEYPSKEYQSHKHPSQEYQSKEHPSSAVANPQTDQTIQMPAKKLVSLLPARDKQEHPLIIATNDFRGEQQLAQNGNKPENGISTGKEISSNEIPNDLIGSSNAGDKSSNANNTMSRKTGLALARTFYRDGKTMIQRGHLPHLNISARNKSNSLLPTIQMGLRLENHVIMASFNQ